MSENVVVSGIEGDFVAFKAPSGQWNVNLDAYLVSLNASFGFNTTPHSFSLQFVPKSFNGASGQLPAIGTYTTYEIRGDACDDGFYLAGVVKHADYENNAGGTTIRIDIEDRRREILDQVTITTEDLGGNIPSGIVSVAAMYRRSIGFLDTSGEVSDSRVKEYRRIHELGATYQQIYEALMVASGINQTTFDVTKLPHPTVVAANMRGLIEPLRFKFTADPLSTVISTILSDSAYDWYWGMRDDTVKVVNRKVSFNVLEDSLPVQRLQPDNTDFKFGQDYVENPTKVTVLGAHRQGILNSRLLSPLDGIAEPNTSFLFTPAWSNINVSFYDAYGIYRSYKPSEKELQMALAGIEFWTYFKLYQVPTFGVASDAGYVAAQHDTFQSRLDPLMPLADYYNNSESGIRVIANRIDEEHNWVLEWYEAIASHANAHYGKTYVLESFAFNPTSGEFALVDSAWCNLENQISPVGSLFEENYQVDLRYAAVSPFLTDDFRVAAHAVMPSSTVYGVEGVEAPAAFSDWNEDVHPSGDVTYEHYIPVTLSPVGQRIVNPRDPGNAFEDFPDGSILATFPIIVASGRFADSVLRNLVTLTELGAQAAQSGTFDIFSPYYLIQAYSGISGIAIPIELRERYGQVWPSTWASGTGSGTKAAVMIDDKFAPWNYFPVGNKTSVHVMSERVSGFMEAQIVNLNSSRFAEITKIDWPVIGFDGFSNQSQVSGMYGGRDHGITDVSVSYSNGVPTTIYGIKSFFSDFIKDAPLGDRHYADLNNVIHPIDFMELRNVPGNAPPPPRPSNPVRRPFIAPPQTIRKEVYAVTITSVDNRGDTTEPERYYSITKDNVPKPGGTVDQFDDEDLICRDGFLNVGDKCLYHVEYSVGNRRRRYYTGGTDLTAGAAVVEVTNVDTINGIVNIGYRGFEIPNVKIMPGSNADNIVVGESGSLQTDGSMHGDNGANITGLRPEVDAPSGVYYIPVVSGSASSAATPVIINSISSFGTSGALATVQPVIGNIDFTFTGSGSSTGNVLIIPYPQFARSGDIGIYCTNNASGFVFINRQSFLSFN